MRKTTRALTILTASAAMVFGAAACEEATEQDVADEQTQAQRGALGGHLAQHVDLDENQEAQLAELRTRLESERAATRSALDAKREELQQLWAAESPDRTAILAASEELATLQANARSQRMEARQAIHGILTDEQRSQLAEQRPMRRFERGQDNVDGGEARGQRRGKQGRRFRRGPGNGDGEGMGHRRGRRMGRGEGNVDGEATGHRRGRRMGRGEGNADGEGMGHRRGRRMGRGHHGGGEGHGMMGRGLDRRLNLDENQQAQVQTLRQQMREQLAPTREQLHELRTQMRTARRTAEPDTAAIEALEAQMAPLQRTMREAQVDFRLSLIELLNAEQRTQLAEMPMMMGGGGGHGRHGRRGHRMGGPGMGAHGGPGMGGPGMGRRGGRHMGHGPMHGGETH